MKLYDLAERFVGELEVSGRKHNPFIVWCHASTTGKFEEDEVPWCSSFINRLAWLLRLPRSKSAAARSWLSVGTAVPVEDARHGDVVILKRGPGEQPGPAVINAPGHVTLFSGWETQPIVSSDLLLPHKYRVTLPERFNGLGGNQSNGVTVALFKTADILGVRRIEG